MHPNLADHLHSEKCREVIAALQQCHVEHPHKKFLGACNHLKRALNRCLQEEYQVKQKQNYQESIDRKERYQKFLNQAEENSK